MDRIITEIKYALRDFVLAYGLAVIATLFFRWLYHVDSPITLDTLWKLMFLSFSGVLPRLVYYSSHELNEKEWIIRDILHKLILAVVIMVIARFMDIWESVIDGIIVLVVLFFIDFAINLLAYSKNATVAAKINQKLKERRKEQAEEFDT